MVKPIIKLEPMPTPTPTPEPKVYPLFRNLTNNPIWFKQENGTVIEIYPSLQDREEIINIKRSIVSALQVTIRDQDGVWSETETDILGKCKVHMTQSQLGNETIVLKKRDMDTCDNRPDQTLLMPSPDQEAIFVYGSTSSIYKLDADKRIKSVEIQQLEWLSPLSKDAGSLGTTMHVLLERNDAVDPSPCSTKPTPPSSRPLKFSHMRSLKPEDLTCGSKPMELIGNLSDALPRDVPHLFLQLIDEMRQCNLDELKALNETYIQCKKVVAPVYDREESYEAKEIMEKHTYFLDALAYVGTEPAVELIVDLITNDSTCLNKSRKVELALSLGLLPYHRITPCTLLNHTLNLARKNSTNMVVILVLGTVVNDALEYPEETCQDLIDTAVEFLVTKIKEDIEKLPVNYDLLKDYNNSEEERKTTFYDSVIHAVKALGNAGVPKNAYLTLLELVNDRRLQTEGRVSVIKAFELIGRRLPLRVAQKTWAVYTNSTEEIEVRLAAFEVFMSTLNADVLSPLNFYELDRQLSTETNSYVKSYTCSYLMALNAVENPTLRRQRTLVNYLLNFNGLFFTCLATDRGFLSSKVIQHYLSLADTPLPRSLPRDVMGVGLFLGTVNTDKAWIPRSVNGKLIANLFGYDLELLEVGARGTGIERLMQQLLGPTGYLRLGTREMGPSGLELPDITLDWNKEDISASTYVKVLGSERWWGYISEPTIMRFLYGKNKNLDTLREAFTEATFGRFSFDTIQDIFYKTLDLVVKGRTKVYQGTFNFTKTIRLGEIRRTIPTILGLPLNLTAVAAGHLQLDALTAVDYCSKTPIVQLLFGIEPRDRLEVYGEIHPKISVLSEVQWVLDAYEVQPKLVFRASATSSFTQRARAVLHDNYTVNFQILEVPENLSVLFNAPYTQYEEVEGVRNVLGIEKRKNTMLYEPISHAGLTLLTDISYPNSTDVDQAPFWPLSGPASLTFVMSREDLRLSGFDITFWNNTNIFLDDGSFSFSIDAMGIGQKLNASAEWSTDTEQKQKLVTVDLVSVPVNMTAEFTGNTTKRLEIEGYVSIDTNVSNTVAYTRFNRTHFYGNLSRSRHAEDRSTAIIVEPEFTLEVTSSLHNNTFGNFSAELRLGDSEWPHWVKANITTRGIMVDINATSNLFTDVNFGYVLPHPVLARKHSLNSLSHYGADLISLSSNLLRL
jgi:hypothetical protein